MAVIISDIHGDICKARAFLAHKPEVEHVSLGDMVDSRTPGATLEDELACLDLLFSSDAVLLWGNHDLVYTPERPWLCGNSAVYSLSDEDMRRYSETSEYLMEIYEEYGGCLYPRHIFTDRFLRQRQRLKAAHAVDGWLCTHAGLALGVAAIIPPDVLSCGIEGVADWLNEEFQRELRIPVYRTSEAPQRYGEGPLFQVHRCRKGADPFGGIFWFDPIREIVDPSPVVGRQIFGHTPTPSPELGPYWVNLNIIQEGVWVFDTELCELSDIA